MAKTRKSGNDFIIQKTTIRPGESKLVPLPVGSLPSGNAITIDAHVFRSKRPGPCVLVMAGIHGDEINGIEILRRTLEKNYFRHLKRGSVIAIPLLNVYGFIHFSREVPDGKDVNRSFPGTSKGSLASRVAYTLSKKVLPLVDLGIDFHTGGNSVYNYPQVRYSKDHEQSKVLAEATGIPYLISNRPIPKSLRRTALDQGIPILTFEGGESLRFDGFSIERGLAAIQRLLHHKGMIDTAPAPPAQQPVIFERSTWLRASQAGIFRWIQSAGQHVFKGEPLGLISDIHGKKSIHIFAPADAYIIGHNNAPVVSQGDALFHLAYPSNTAPSH